MSTECANRPPRPQTFAVPSSCPPRTKRRADAKATPRACRRSPKSRTLRGFSGRACLLPPRVDQFATHGSPCVITREGVAINSTIGSSMQRNDEERSSSNPPLPPALITNVLREFHQFGVKFPFFSFKRNGTRWNMDASKVRTLCNLLSADFFNSLHSSLSLERKNIYTQTFQDTMCEDLYVYAYVIVIIWSVVSKIPNVLRIHRLQL